MSGARGPWDAEELLVAWLTAELDIAVAGVSTEKPGDLEDIANLPWLTVRRIGSTFVDRQTLRLERVRLDLDAFAETEPGAFDVIASAIRAVAELGDARYVHPAGVTTATEVDLGPINLPDPDTDRAHYAATVAIFGHAIAEAS